MTYLSTLFLDAGGVLVNPNWDRIAVLMSRRGLTASSAALRAGQLRAGHKLDTEELVRQTDDARRWSIYLETTFAEAGLRVPPSALAPLLEELRSIHDEENLWESVPDGTAEALDRLRAAGYRLVVVSNANGTVRAKLARLGLASRFDFVLDSFEEGVEKPDPRFFRIALDRSGARAESTIHVGDIYHIDVVGARAAGIRAVLMDPAGLYADRDVPRVVSLGALADDLASGRL